MSAAAYAGWANNTPTRTPAIIQAFPTRPPRTDGRSVRARHTTQAANRLLPAFAEASPVEHLLGLFFSMTPDRGRFGRIPKRQDRQQVQVVRDSQQLFDPLPL